MYPPLNKEFSNELILENNTDHIGLENNIFHELLDVEVDHLQQRYQQLLEQSPSQPEQTISNNKCSKEPDVSKKNEAIESIVWNPESNKDTPSLN